MKNLHILPIEKSNPLINTYIKTINNWDEEGIFMESLDTESKKQVYAIYFDGYFLAASNITLNPETRIASIYTVNGSNNNRETVNDYMVNELPKIAINDFGATNYIFNNVQNSRVRVKSL